MADQAPNPAASSLVLDTTSHLHELWFRLWNKPLETTAAPGTETDTETKSESDSGSDSDCEPEKPLTYIDLKTSPWLSFAKLSPLTDLLVRPDYLELIEYIEKASAHKRRLSIFLTGQPGIGKSLGLYCMLLHRISKGKPVFLQYETDKAYYFNEAGFHTVNNPSGASNELRTALEDSWVLVDVDDRSWKPQPAGWLSGAPVLVMASPPNPRCQSHFMIQFRGVLWIMSPWNWDELVLEAGLRGIPDPEETVQERYTFCGPVTRTMFDIDPRPDEASVRRAFEPVVRMGLAPTLQLAELAMRGMSFSDADGQIDFNIICVQPVRESDDFEAPVTDRHKAEVNLLDKKMMFMLMEHLRTIPGQFQRTIRDMFP